MKRCIFLSLALISAVAAAQNAGEAFRYKLNYRFDKAEAAYEKLVAADSTDAEALKGLIESRNGRILLQYVTRPVTVETKKVARKDFFLWYSHLDDRIWTEEGNLWPADAEEVCFSRKSPAGDMDIVTSSHVDSSLWSAPKRMGDDLVSEGNEILALKSADGRKLYFSSDGLFGIGGYDIYEAVWDNVRHCWGQVRNIGLPYNSPADDFLYSDTPDGKYTLIASNRDCGKDSVVIYVLEQEVAVQSPASQEEAARLARLQATGGAGRYGFVKHLPAPMPEVTFEEDESDFDYDFRVGQGAFATNNSLPKGLVYQIQMFVASKRPPVKALKGVSPVFEHRQPTGKYLYAAGLFKTYKEAETALGQVRRAGFREAFIIAYDGGRSISVKKAREKESSVTVVTEEVHIVK